MFSSISSMANRLTHSSRWASLAATASYNSSGTRSRVTQYPALMTSLLLEEPFLEVFDLGEESDDIAPDPLHGTHHREPAVGALRPPRLQVIYVQNLVLEVEVQLPLQEALEVL